MDKIYRMIKFILFLYENRINNTKFCFFNNLNKKDLTFIDKPLSEGGILYLVIMHYIYDI